jgi:hypothetical protein
MKRRILIVLLGLIVLSQIPFAYRRYRLARLGNAIQQIAARRLPPARDDKYLDYKGVIHVHSSLGGHSSGTFTELVAAAKSNGLDFVIMTEHPQRDFDTSAMTLSGLHAGVLFINGNEVETANEDRLLLIPGDASANTAPTMPTQQVIDQQKARGGLAIVAYPAEFHSWQAAGYDGVEVYNLFTNTRRLNRAITFFDALWSFRSYADLMFANFFARPSDQEKFWDNAIVSSDRKLTAIAGNDAHSNVGLSINDSAGKQLAGIRLDPYERSFRLVRTHALIERGEPLTRESLLDAIRRGRCYISFDLFGEPKGFSFVAQKDTQQFTMGDDVSFVNGLWLKASAPLPVRFVLFRNGNVADEKSDGPAVEFEIHEKGAYRIEVYLDSLPLPATGKPWIISNPIYIR